jgi:tRNA-modifying protein YgfZ
MGTTMRKFRQPGLGLLAARGPDARKFLQGQLSQDVLTLGPEELRLAGCHNPQGRVLAVLWLVADGDDVLALCPRELLPELLVTLRRFTLRAKVTLSDETAQWRVTGLVAGSEADAGGLRAMPGLRLFPRGVTGRRWLALQSAAQPDTLADIAPGDDCGTDEEAANAWTLLEIADGLPQITLATRGEFVAQMLNLDVLGGIAFDKGCYTGQEVIARAHYRGKVKRRAQRFRSADPASAWPPGTSGRLMDGRRFQIVISAGTGEGGSEWLAVTNPPPATAGTQEPLADDTEPAREESLRSVTAQALPLPFALPD